MENLSILSIEDNGVENGEDNAAKVDQIGNCADELIVKVDELEQRVNEVEQFYMTSSTKQPNAPKSSSKLKDKERMKHIPGFKRHQQDASRREAAAAKRMQELMRQFGSILRQITQHKWAWPFMQPVDVEGLGLHDYFEVIDRPMDFSTIKNQMEAKDGTGYKHVRDICADVRLVFKNAMKYNDDKSHVHVMAKTLLEKFEEKWLQLLPRVTEEEKRREEEEAEALLNMQRVQEVAHAKMARDLCGELYEAEMHLEELREVVVRNCRKMSIQDKRNLGIALTRLSPENLGKALEILARNNPSIQAASSDIDLDFTAQSESTLWRLRIFVKDALEAQGKSSSMGGGNSAEASRPTINSKRKNEVCNALVKTAKKKNKKHPS